jgi:hypothetical protein
MARKNLFITVSGVLLFRNLLARNELKGIWSGNFDGTSHDMLHCFHQVAVGDKLFGRKQLVFVQLEPNAVIME